MKLAGTKIAVCVCLCVYVCVHPQLIIMCTKHAILLLCHYIATSAMEATAGSIDQGTSS